MQKSSQNKSTWQNLTSGNHNHGIPLIGFFWSLALSTFSIPIDLTGTGSTTEEFEATKSKEDMVQV